MSKLIGNGKAKSELKKRQDSALQMQREANEMQIKAQLEVYNKDTKKSCLSHAIAYYSEVLGGQGDERGDIVVKPQEVLDTAKEFYDWINEPVV